MLRIVFEGRSLTFPPSCVQHKGRCWVQRWPHGSFDPTSMLKLTYTIIKEAGDGIMVPPHSGPGEPWSGTHFKLEMFDKTAYSNILHTGLSHITRISFLTLMFFCRINEIPPHYLGAEGRINDCASWSTEDCGNIWEIVFIRVIRSGFNKKKKKDGIRHDLKRFHRTIECSFLLNQIL